MGEAIRGRELRGRNVDMTRSITVHTTFAGEQADSPGVDIRRAEAAVRELLLAVGENPDREGLRDTPRELHGPTARSSLGCSRIPATCSRQPLR
jgi:GTP cyclohydrolase I